MWYLFLHDIGKVPDEEPELPHAILGMKMAEKFGEKPGSAPKALKKVEQRYEVIIFVIYLV